MYPDEFIRCLWQFKHPAFSSCSVEQNRWGNRNRELVGLAPHGTVWFATPLERSQARGRASGEGEDAKAEPFIVPANCIPYATFVPSEIDPITGRKVSALLDPKTRRFRPGLMRGWLDTLTRLTSEGYFRPDPDLSFLIGADSRALVPRHLWL